MNLTKETKLTLVYISIAFLFSVSMRLIWIYQFGGYEPFMFNGQFMINTNDGYFWAEGARDLLSGSSTNPSAENFYDTFHQLHDLSPVSSAASQLTAFFAYILPFSFESVILYMPIFLGSLVVVPIILIAKNLKNLEMGLIAALLASIAWSYYNRTMVGYYDTDMLNIVIPTFLLWSIIWAMTTNQNRYLLITALDILVYRWWYPQSYALEFSFFGLILLYTLIYDRKNIYNYKLLSIMMFAMLNIDGYIRFPLVLGIFYIFRQEKFDKYIYYIFGVSVLAFFMSGGFNPIWSQLKGYVFTDAISQAEKGMQLHFYSVMQTVREAGKIPFETFANRISGHTVTFLLSVIGYAWLSYKHRIMLFALPLVGLGFLAWFGGLRFTIYAVPPLALGMAFLIVEVSRFPVKLRMTGKSKHEMTGKSKHNITGKSTFSSSLGLTRGSILILLTSAILAPNIQHIIEYKVPTVFTKDEVKVLDNLGKITSREDYVVSWWDYGYPIRYYADVKTLVDGGKHGGSVNFPVSYILTNSQDEAARMARLDVEYTEKTFTFRDENKQLIIDKNLTIFSNIEQMTKEYGYDDTNDFLLSLDTDIKLPKKTRDIYLFLPFRMLNIYPTVKVFSNLDLMSGQKYNRPLFYISTNYKQIKNILHLGNGVSLDLNTKILSLGDKKTMIRRFVTTVYDKKMRLKKKVDLVDFSSNISVIYMKNYNTFLILDEATYNSTYIQLMVLEEYDAKLFEPVELTPHAKVYKLKI